jgi:8-oxo-dGTP pyrophosphatase MutT (NUDIX family)
LNGVTPSGDPLAGLRAALLDPEHAIGMEVKGGKKEAAVLVPVYDWPGSPGLLMTERRADLRRHAGEISFPGGRRDQGEHLIATALREAEEEIGLPGADVEIVGALPPVGTFVTGYRINAFVGVIEPPESLALAPNPESRNSAGMFKARPGTAELMAWKRPGGVEIGAGGREIA